jgi:hypothetical protein
MRIPPLRLLLPALLGATLLLGRPAYAIAVMDISPDVLLQQSADLKAQLHLNANQGILWQQVSGKAQVILRSRMGRREKLQADLKQAVDDKGSELRSMNRKVEDEAELSNAENRQLRELFLTMADALDDGQRQIVQQFLADQLQRLADPVGPIHEPRPNGDGEGRKRKGGMSGNIGGNIGGGMGGRPGSQ